MQVYRSWNQNSHPDDILCSFVFVINFKKCMLFKLYEGALLKIIKKYVYKSSNQNP